MSVAAIVIAVIALLLAFKVKGELSIMSDRLERLERSSSSSAGDEDAARDMQTNRAFIARLASGEELDSEQVLEGRTWGDVNQERAIRLLDQGVRVLDVRTAQETLGGVIPGAIRIAVDELPMRFGELGRPETPTLVYCAMGVRSAAACEFLSQQGFPALHNLEVGFGGWSGPTAKPEG